MNVVLDNCAIISYFVAILIRQYFPGIPIPLIFFITFFNTWNDHSIYHHNCFLFIFQLCQENLFIGVDEASDVAVLKS